MKYTITVNQSALVQSGVIYKTDWVDWCIIDYLKDFVIYKDSKRIIYNNEEYIWLNYRHLIQSMPCIKLVSKSAISKHIKKLERLGLIKTFQAPDNTLYYTFTDSMIGICFCRKKDMERIRKEHPNRLCEGVRRLKQSPITTKSTFVDCHGITAQPRNDNEAESYPHFSRPVLYKETAPVRPERTAQYNTKISIKNKDNKDISFASFLKDKELELRIDTDDDLTKSHCERPKGARQSPEIASATPRKDNLLRNPVNPIQKDIKSFKTLGGVWQVVENIRQRGLVQNQISNIKMQNKMPDKQALDKSEDEG